MHCKDITLKNAMTINFDTIKDMVVNKTDDVKTVNDNFKITRDHKSLLTVHQDKDYKMVFDKRVIMDDYSTRPYGFLIMHCKGGMWMAFRPMSG